MNLEFFGRSTYIPVMTDVAPEESSIPESMLAKLFDATGAEDGSLRGYFLFYVNDKGEPFLTSRFENTAVRFSLEKAMEMFMENDEIDFNFDEE